MLRICGAIPGIDCSCEPIPNSNGSENGIYPPIKWPFLLGKMISIKFGGILSSLGVPYFNTNPFLTCDGTCNGSCTVQCRFDWIWMYLVKPGYHKLVHTVFRYAVYLSTGFVCDLMVYCFDLSYPNFGWSYPQVLSLTNYHANCGFQRFWNNLNMFNICQLYVGPY